MSPPAVSKPIFGPAWTGVVRVDSAGMLGHISLRVQRIMNERRCHQTGWQLGHESRPRGTVHACSCLVGGD